MYEDDENSQCTYFKRVMSIFLRVEMTSKVQFHSDPQVNDKLIRKYTFDGPLIRAQWSWQTNGIG